MKVFIDIRSLDAPIRSGIPEYAFALTSELLKNKGGDEYVLFANSFRKRLETLPLKERADGWVNWKAPNRLLDAATRLFGQPMIDRAIKADVYWSPHFNILKFAEPRYSPVSPAEKNGSRPRPGRRIFGPRGAGSRSPRRTKGRRRRSRDCRV